jgi:hypothetical protein
MHTHDQCLYTLPDISSSATEKANFMDFKLLDRIYVADDMKDW